MIQSFLSGANIMDYSLLVGVDDERKELVVGIVGMSLFGAGSVLAGSKFLI